MAPEIRMEVLERPDIQALILRSYANLPDTRYYFLKIEDRRAFKLWLAGVIPQVTTGNLRAIAQTGVDRISVGALTHSATALDIALDYGTG